MAKVHTFHTPNEKNASGLLTKSVLSTVCNIYNIYNLADVYHCDNIDRVSDDFIEAAHVKLGNFDNVADCGYAVPSHWDIGKVYKRLIKMVAEDEQIDVIDALIEVYNSFISPKIDDYNSSFYYENPNYIFECYKEKKIL